MPFAALLAPIIADVVGLALGAEAAAAVAAPIIAGVSAADVIGGTLAGAAGGALLGGVEGGGQGALRGAAGGALTGGALSFVPAVGGAISGALGVGQTVGDVAAGVALGAGAGALGSAVTGGKPLTGAETGGIAGLATGLTAPGTSTGAATAPAGTGPATSPATVSIPASGGTSTGDSASAMGDLFSPNVQGGSIVTGPASQVSASPLGTTTGTISGSSGGGGVGTISGSTGGTGSISPTPDLSIGMTPAQQSATLGALTDPSQIAEVQGPSLGDKLLGGIEDYVTNPKNLIQLGIGGAGLLMSSLKGNAEQADLSALQGAATSASTTARALEAPLFSGVLPPGAQTDLDLSRRNQIAQVRSSYASMGMAGSTGEADAINAVNQNVAGQQFNIEDALFGQAAPYASLASSDYQQVLQGQRLQDEDFGNALSRFVAAITGGTSGTKTAA